MKSSYQQDFHLHHADENLANKMKNKCAGECGEKKQRKDKKT